MKVLELFDKDSKGDVGENDSSQYEESKEIGEWYISFQGRNQGRNEWEVFFIAIDKEKGESTWDPVDAGGKELEVFSFVVSAMRRFIKKNEPKRINFTSKKIEGSRIKLYQRLVKRFLSDTYIAREFEIGLGSAEKYIQFDLIKKPSGEGLK